MDDNFAPIISFINDKIYIFATVYSISTEGYYKIYFVTYEKICFLILLCFLFICCESNSNIDTVDEQKVNITVVKDFSDCNVIDDSISLIPLDTKSAINSGCSCVLKLFDQLMH